MLSLNAFLVYSTIALIPLTSSAPVHRSNFVLPDILFNVKTARQNWLQAQKFFTRGEHLRHPSHGVEYPSIVCPSSVADSEKEPIIASIGETAVGDGELVPVLVCPTHWLICQYSMLSGKLAVETVLDSHIDESCPSHAPIAQVGITPNHLREPSSTLDDDDDEEELASLIRSFIYSETLHHNNKQQSDSFFDFERRHPSPNIPIIQLTITPLPEAPCVLLRVLETLREWASTLKWLLKSPPRAMELDLDVIAMWQE